MPTSPAIRWQTEQLFHDEQAAERARAFQTGRAELRFADDEFLNHETWIRYAVGQLGPLNGRDVLDLGCGHGMAAVVFARQGARVVGCDLSPGYISEARARTRANDVSISFQVANAETLPFPEASFDAIWGNAILHHLDLVQVAEELHRVLRPGGVAVFCEPWGGNPILDFARRHLPYPGKERTPDEQPLRTADLAPLQDRFPDLNLKGFQLFGMIRRVVKASWMCAPFDGLDRISLAAVPQLKNWCRYLVLTLRRGKV